jgi:hypothetical protein
MHAIILGPRRTIVKLRGEANLEFIKNLQLDGNVSTSEELFMTGKN